MKRREFIKSTTAATALSGLGLLSLGSCSDSNGKHLTILHTNDVHSHIDPFPKVHPSYPNLGGFSRRATLVDTIRKENPNTLLFDAGDYFQGTPYFNFYGGELEFKLMSMLNYDAVTIGNHDFDNGINGLYAQLPHANFDLLCANYDFKNTVMNGHVKKHKIFTVDGLKIGVYGIGIELKGLVNAALYKETTYIHPYALAQDAEKELKVYEKCDLVICLSHLGYDYENKNKPNDLALAQKTEFTDLIIGGHTHTFLDKPTIVKNKNEKDVLVNQVGCYGINLGRIDFYFDTLKKVNANGLSITV